MKKEYDQAAKIKPGELKSNSEFRAHAAANQWQDRRKNGWPYHGADVYDFIEKTYERWIGKGLVQSDLKDVDEPLWWALQNRLRKEPLPESMNLPKIADAILEALDDPKEKELLEAARKWNAKRVRIQRSLNKS